MEEKKVSVIMPTYKDKGGLRKAIKSVLSQTYNNIELIVVDDNNPGTELRNHTEKVMHEFELDPRVVYIKHETNKNGAAARNTGIKASKGDYIAFLDDDDWFLKEKMERQVSYLDNHPEFDAVYNFALMDSSPIPTVPYEGDNSKPLLLMETRMFTPSLCFRAETIKAIHGFDESYRRHQDYEMLLRFFAAGYRIGCLKEYLTGLGSNRGENIPSPEKLLELKHYFFNKFDSVIDSFSEDDKPFKKRVYAKHFGTVAWYALKAHKLGLCVRLCYKYFWYSPSFFSLAARENISAYIKRHIIKGR